MSFVYVRLEDLRQKVEALKVEVAVRHHISLMVVWVSLQGVCRDLTRLRGDGLTAWPGFTNLQGLRPLVVACSTAK